MCGIAGFFHYNKDRSADATRLQRMTDVIAHRGPDGEGFFINGSLALGHRRLSVIDIASGVQPMHKHNCSIVFNGEIYNYIELRRELEHYGYQFTTASDTEVIMSAYRHWGESCVQHFNGMWAFALWDEENQHLFCSRDRLGEKPLYYAEHDGTFVFASEIKSLWEFGVAREMNEEILDAYLCFTYIPAPHTFYKNIYKVEAGYNLVVTKYGIQKKCYWDIPLIQPNEHRKFQEEDIHSQFEFLLRDSIRLRMRSDVPFGAFLSGGLDSSTVVSIMADLQNSPVETFTIGFDDEQFDERDLARSVSQSYHTNHHEYVVTPNDAQEAIERLAWHYDEPFGDATALPTYIVSKIARKHVTMVLTGDGGDEALSGYTIHQGEMFAQHLNMIPKPLRVALPYISRAASRFSPRSLQQQMQRAHDVITSSITNFPTRLLYKQNGFRNNERLDLLAPSKSIRPAEDFIRDTLRPVQHLDSFSQLNYWLLKVALPDDMLTKSDRATMAHSLEARVPFLDHRLIELLAVVPMSYKMKNYTRKYILRQTVAKNLPQELLTTKKRGFVLPLENWIRNGAATTLISKAKYAADVGLVRNEAIKRITDDHLQGKRNAGEALWTLAMLGEAMK